MLGADVYGRDQLSEISDNQNQRPGAECQREFRFFFREAKERIADTSNSPMARFLFWE